MNAKKYSLVPVIAGLAAASCLGMATASQAATPSAPASSLVTTTAAHVDDPAQSAATDPLRLTRSQSVDYAFGLTPRGSGARFMPIQQSVSYEHGVVLSGAGWMASLQIDSNLQPYYVRGASDITPNMYSVAIMNHDTGAVLAIAPIEPGTVITLR